MDGVNYRTQSMVHSGQPPTMALDSSGSNHWILTELSLYHTMVSVHLLDQEKVIKVMKTDGKILEYKAPMKVHQLLSEFSGHAISDALPVVQHLRTEAELLGGQLYYLLPLPVPPPEFNKKMLRFSNSVVEGEEGSRVVRIKLVVSKQELEVMLRKGEVSIDDMISQLQKEKDMNGVAKFDDDGKCKGWKPLLESIPEGN
ncbi:hypothetical protein F0562_016772 [Nyssa sinensis]|uniref:Uncharacterized protein n=1 Tax=Nyssa sinensis TaxID=561372 RepID=A0A5J4ZGJ4_9ASTE|nr:hypothetical protein F0562_016772 [Nyssa sinensis]